MAIIEINSAELVGMINKNSKKKYSKKEILDKLNELGVDVELEIREGEEIFIIEVFPNRPDLLSKHGIARALRLFLGTDKPKTYRARKSNYRIIIDESVRNVRPFTACAVVKGLRLSNEDIRDIIILQEKLHQTLCRNRRKAAIGIYPMEKIKWPITYKALKPEKIRFKPLGINKEMNGIEILEMHPTGQEYAGLLEGKNKYPIFIDAKNNILSMPPIINSEDTGKITEETRDVFIEVSGFDPEFLNKVLSIIVTSLIDMGGILYEVEMNYPYSALKGKKKYKSPDLTMEKLVIDLREVKKLVGVGISEREAVRLLERMGIIYRNKIAYIPPYRIDIFSHADIAEEIAISYGYSNIEGELPELATIGAMDNKHRIIEMISDICIGMGLLEVKNYSLINREEALRTSKKRPIRIINAKNSNYNTLRPSLLASILNTLKRWMHEEYPQRIFEIGEVFIRKEEYDGPMKDEWIENNIAEPLMLGIGIAGSNEDFSRAKIIVETMLGILGKKAEYKPLKDKRFINGRAARIILNGKDIGIIGELHPEIIEYYGLEMPISFIEIDLEKII
ncbi:phenylalanine--tRNA ligase subunit beta [Candidatus Woesearchaeota archaeon]|nr:phenylalanine--tRNA ligase subunit beta [Candidatus Woesearchaeota archaeon]